MQLLRSALLLTLTMVSVPAILGRAQVPPQDVGTAGVWQKLLKLRTTASALHTTAHPDDEHGGMLAMLSRGEGVRVALATLTRGEAGDNAIGPELFDALGLIRTEELLVADRYYGVDNQYFTSVADYGFSKRLDEALDKWGRDHVLRDLVRIIRIDRPMVVISRFQGNPRDGHGNHEAAGLLTREAFRLAGDPQAFPEQIAAGLRAWQPMKLYVGGVRESEDWNVRLDTGAYDPLLGDSYQSIARLGLSFQRSQNAGRVGVQAGPAMSYYRRMQMVTGLEAPDKEQSFFDGIDTTIAGLYRALRKTPTGDAVDVLSRIDREIKAALDEFSFTEPSRSAPALVRALRAITLALSLPGVDEDVKANLEVKRRQITEAIPAVLGISLTALAQPTEMTAPAGVFDAGARPMGPVVPGQRLDVRVTFVNRSPVAVQSVLFRLEGKGNWQVGDAPPPADAAANQPIARTFRVVAPEEAIARPHFTRKSIQQARYMITDESAREQPVGSPALAVVARCDVDGVPLEIRRPVARLEPNPPYGFDTPTLAVVPAISVSLSPEHAIVRRSEQARTIRLRVEVLNNREEGADGELALELPAGWKVTPASRRFSLTRPGERSVYSFDVSASPAENGATRIQAIARSGGRDHREGYTILRHRDLETRYLYREAVTTVRSVDVRIVSGLRIGYVMGIGDDVPSGIAQLGADVELLGERELAAADLSRFHAVVIGTRAYAVREDLRTYNRRLLDYVQNGGNLVVLYNTQEMVPNLHAPYPGDLPRNAEEVSEEDSPVEILAPEARVLTTPNRIARDDFDGWVEQRGSKFWASWDPRYTTIIATWDKGQAPQKGGWLHARYGKGHYTYFAYALHRQLPYGVAGAYRLLANLLSLAPDDGRGK